MCVYKVEVLNRIKLNNFVFWDPNYNIFLITIFNFQLLMVGCWFVGAPVKSVREYKQSRNTVPNIVPLGAL